MRRLTPIAALAATLALVAAAPAAAAEVSAAQVRAKAVVWAEQQVGVHESGFSNCHPVISRWQREMGLRTPPCRPWCGVFVHQAFLRGGVRLSARMIDPHLAYYDALARRRHLRRIPRGIVRRGDLVLFKYRSGVKASHFGIVRYAVRPGAQWVHTVEGNASHAVRTGVRPLASVVLAARVVTEP